MGYVAYIAVTPKPKTKNMECSYCHLATDDVCQMALCTNRCVIHAHASCFEGRMLTSAWKKKHKKRGNNDPELCATRGCLGKLRLKEAKEAKDGDVCLPIKEGTARKARNKKKDEPQVDASEGLCGYTMKDGRLCCRKVVENGACVLHCKKPLSSSALQRLSRLMTSRLRVTN